DRREQNQRQNSDKWCRENAGLCPHWLFENLDRKSGAVFLPCEAVAERGWGTTRRVVEGARVTQSFSHALVLSNNMPPPPCGACHRAGHFRPDPLAWSPSPASGGGRGAFLYRSTQRRFKSGLQRPRRRREPSPRVIVEQW